MRTLPSRWAHSLVGACGFSFLQEEVRTVPGQCAQSLVHAHTPQFMCTLPRGVGGWVERRLELLLQGNSQSAPEGLFLFGKILLLNPEAPYKEGPVLSLSPPLQLDWDCPGQGPTWPNSQFSPASAHSLSGFTTWSSFPSLWLQATRSLTVLLKPCLSGEGAINPALSQESCSRPGTCRPWGYSCPGPHAGPRDIIVLKQSP